MSACEDDSDDDEDDEGFVQRDSVIDVGQVRVVKTGLSLQILKIKL